MDIPLLHKGSLFLFMLMGAATAPHQFTSPGCDAIDVQIEVTSPSSPLQKNSVEAKVTGAAQPVYFIFYKPTGQLISSDVTKSKISDIDPGTYYCSVVDGKGCSKKTEFKIE